MAILRKNIYLGVDGGGTKTEAVLIDDKGQIVGQGQAGGSNPAVFGIKKSLDNIATAIKKTIKNFPGTAGIPACLAIAGVNTKKEAENFRKAALAHSKLSKIISKNSIVVNDTQAALRAGTNEKNAIVLIAGTGSNCFGVNESGQIAKSGGRDFILSDEGSGYAIGLSVLKGVTKMSDGRASMSVLKDLLFSQLKINSIDQLTEIVNSKPWNKTDIANVAPLAEKAVQKGDRLASEIIKTAAGELGMLIKAVAEKLDLKNKEYTIVTTGSVFNIQKILDENLKKDVLKFSPYAVFVKPKVDSATGAALLAKELKG